MTTFLYCLDDAEDVLNTTDIFENDRKNSNAVVFLNISNLQRDPGQLNMHVHVGKCQSTHPMIISHKRNPIKPVPLTLDGIPLEQVTAFKYLSILLTSDLSWSSHISTTCSKPKNYLACCTDVSTIMPMPLLCPSLPPFLSLKILQLT